MSGYAPQNMFDSNLTTAYKPDTTEAGYITYTLSENLDVTKMNIIQKDANSNAKVLVLVDGENGKEWVQVGTLSKPLNEIYLPFWKNQVLDYLLHLVKQLMHYPIVFVYYCYLLKFQ